MYIHTHTCIHIYIYTYKLYIYTYTWRNQKPKMVSLQPVSSIFFSFPEFKTRNSCGENPEIFRVFQGDLCYITKMKLCKSVSEITYIAILRDLCIYIYMYMHVYIRAYMYIHTSNFSLHLHYRLCISHVPSNKSNSTNWEFRAG